MRALLLVDIQNDFLPGGKLAVDDGNLIIPIVNTIEPGFDLVLATQDWHPPNHLSFASNHPGKIAFETINLNGLDQVLWPDHCLHGSWGAELSKELSSLKIEAIFRKGTSSLIDSYSGFYDNGHLKSTGLSGYLKEKKVSQLYVAGLAGDFCVYYSVKDALAEGFETYLIEDATKPINEKNFRAAKEDIKNQGGKIITSNEIRAIFETS